MEKMKNNNKRKFFICNRFQKKILLLVFFSSIIPVAISCICLFYLIFNVTANELVFPEAIASSLIPAAKKVAIVALISLPFSLWIIGWWAYHVSYKFAGPLCRLYREMDERIEGRTKAHIKFRKGDYLAELADKINALLDKLPR
jgi:hypothetical protein